MSDYAPTTIRDELSVLSYEHPDGYRAHLHSKAIDAILTSSVVHRIQAEAWDQGYEAGYDDRLFEERGMSSDPDAHPHHNPYIEQNSEGNET